MALLSGCRHGISVWRWHDLREHDLALVAGASTQQCRFSDAEVVPGMVRCVIGGLSCRRTAVTQPAHLLGSAELAVEVWDDA